MGNFWKYNDKVGAGVSGLSTANGGDAIADNEIIRGDGTTGIQGGVLTSADHNGDIAGPTASTDTTIAGQDFGNQPANDGVTVVSDAAGDTTQTITIIGTTTGTDTVVTEDIVLNGVVAVNSVKVNWGQILAAKLSAACAGTVTITETSGGLTITTIAPAATSKGVDTGSISCWNRIPYVVASGASTKQIGLKGTDSTGATIYDSQALTGATSLLMNSAFVTVTEYYIGDLESTRTATITAQAGVGIATITGTSANGNVTVDPQGTGAFVVSGKVGIEGSSPTVPLDVNVTNPSGGNVARFKSNADNIVELAAGASKENATRYTQNAANKWVVGQLDTSFASAAGDFSFYDYGNAAIDLIIRDTTGYVAVPSDSQYQFSSTTSAEGTADTALGRVAAGQIAVLNVTNGQATNIKTSATTVNLAGATSTATGLFPAKCIQLGVTARVTTLITSGDGGTSMNIGDGTDADRYGATIAFAAGTTVNLSDATADPRGWAAAAGDVVFTCVGGTFNAGVVRVVAHYIDLTAPTS